MAGYSRTDTTNNIADGNIINASDFDGEFDAIATALERQDIRMMARQRMVEL